MLGQWKDSEAIKQWQEMVHPRYDHRRLLSALRSCYFLALWELDIHPPPIYLWNPEICSWPLWSACSYPASSERQPSPKGWRRPRYSPTWLDGASIPQNLSATAPRLCCRTFPSLELWIASSRIPSSFESKNQKSARQDVALHCLSHDCGDIMVKTEQLDNNQWSNRSISSGCSGWPMLLIAIAAVNGPCSVRLEWDLSLLPAFWASYVCHFSWTTVIAASAAATAVFIFSFKHLIHLPFVSIQRIEPATKNISTNLFESTQM